MSTCKALKADKTKCTAKITNSNGKTCNIKAHINQFSKEEKDEKDEEEESKVTAPAAVVILKVEKPIIIKQEKISTKKKTITTTKMIIPKTTVTAPTSNRKVDLPERILNPKNCEEINKKLLKKFKQGPVETDEPGYIYIFRRDDKTKNEFTGKFKVGRTKRLPERRMKEWGDAILVESFAVTKNRYAERVIHLCLDYCRCYISVPTKDKPDKLEIEWFEEDLAVIKKVIKDEIREINAIYS